MSENEPQSERAILIRYDEIALKKAKRGWFEKRLAMNLVKMIQKRTKSPVQYEREKGRILLEGWAPETLEGVQRTFGLTSFSPVLKVETQVDQIERVAVDVFKNWIENHSVPKTFRVRTRRSDKSTQETSPELDRKIGSQIKSLYPEMTVQLKRPELTLGIEIRDKKSFVWIEKRKGLGGLPVGSNGRVLSLISGGLDSPVAAIQILKRGSPTSFIYFDGTPFVDESVLLKVEDLVKIVNSYSPFREKLYVVPFGKIQEKVALVSSPRMRTLLYRRLMFRIATEVGRNIGAKALVTGESLGQVASQTVENLQTTDESSGLPILRPLITMDKVEIVEAARNLGTYETSIRPGTDCCTLFADRHPVIHGTPQMATREEERFDVEALVKEAVELTYGKQL